MYFRGVSRVCHECLPGCRSRVPESSGDFHQIYGNFYPILRSVLLVEKQKKISRFSAV